MKHAAKGVRATALAALAMGVVTATTVGTASADPASTAITRAILAKQNATPDFQAPRRVLDDPDGDLLPNRTPDGAGGFMFYKPGQLGRGAIYAHPRNGTNRAHTLYGNILASWELRGWETGPDGYPITDERNPVTGDWTTCGGLTPPSRVQRFKKLNSNTGSIACFRPSSTGWGVTWAADSRPV
jgi:uncharacterized protein with LGFP repeats